MSSGCACEGAPGPGADPTRPPPPAPSDLHAALLEQRARLLATEQGLRALRQEVDALRASTSWRVTAPLRWLAERVKGPTPTNASVTATQRLHRRTAGVLRRLPLPDAGRRLLCAGMYGLAPASFAGEPDFEAWRRQRIGRRAIGSLRFDAVEQPDVTVIVPTYGRLDMTLACLCAIAEHRGTASMEVMVVEDASGDADMLRLREVPGLVFHANERNLGFLRSCNAAARRARGQYICLLNNDTEVRAGWLDAMLSLFASHPGCGLVGAKLVYADGRLQEAGGIVWNNGGAHNYGRLGDPDAAEHNYVKEVDYCSGAAIVLPRALFERLGGFDERYLPAYYEDTDLAFRVREAGLKVLLQPAARVIHHEGQSHGTDLGTGVKAHQVGNQKTFHARWAHELGRGHFPPGQCMHLARERAGLRKTILVIDLQVPQPDRDAGSRSTRAIIDTLLGMGLCVKFWPATCAYDPSYTPLLQQAGVEVLYGPPEAGRFARWLDVWADDLDYAFINRPDVAAEFVLQLKARSRAKLLFYGHDLHHLRESAEARLTGSAAAMASAAQTRFVETSLWNQVDTVYYPSYTETEAVRAAAPKVNARTLPLYTLQALDTAPLAGRHRSQLLFVAGFAHAPNADAAAWFVQEVFGQVLAARPDATLVLAGSSPTAQVLALASGQIRVTGYLPEPELQALYRQAGVAVAPLRFGAGVKGKVVEAMHHGLPLVTTSTGTQGLRDVDAAVAVADDPQAMARAILDLMTDDALWNARADAGRHYVASHFSADAMRHVLMQDIDPQPYPSIESRPSHGLRRP